MNLSDRRRWRRAQESIVANDLPAAKAALETLLRNVDDAQAHMLLASILLADGDLRAAIAQFQRAMPALPDDVPTIAKLARSLFMVGETNDARACLLHPAIAACESASELVTVGLVRQLVGEPEAAMALMERGRAIGFDAAEQHYFCGLQLLFVGHAEDARAQMRACLERVPSFGRATLSLARSEKQHGDSQVLASITANIGKCEPGGVDHAAFEFARFKIFDDVGQPAQAWPALERGNDIMAARLPYDGALLARLVDDIVRRCDADFVAADPAAATPPGPVPIFILGMPRTGTTLLERILSNHSQVTSAGELSDFFRQLRILANHHGSAVIDTEVLDGCEDIDYTALGQRYLEQTQWRAGGRAYYVDKLPANWQLAGLIHRALPHAPILHMQRDPMDTCFSNYKALFGDTCSYSYRQDRIGHYALQYQRLMQHWRRVMPAGIHDVSYTDLVSNPEQTTREVLAFCGLPFEPDCIDLSRNTAPVATLSSPQVRGAIHTNSLGEWRRYAEQLEPLRKALGDR